MFSMRSSLFLAAALLLAFAAACQQAKLAEYRAYSNDGDVPRISVEDAKKDYDAGIAVIVDSRPESAFAQEHVAGAINIQNGGSEADFEKLPKGKKIIVYCS
jgi:hypothetical protein